MRAYHKRILLFKPNATKFEVCLDYIKTVNSNIEYFLKDKTKTMEVNVENFEDEPVVFFIFNSKLYRYCKMEGFELKEMLVGFEGEVFEKATIKKFFEFMLDNK